MMEMTLRKYALRGLAGAALGAVLFVTGCASGSGPSPTEISLLQAWAQALDTAADASLAQAETTATAATKAQMVAWQGALDTATKTFVAVNPNAPGTSLPTLAAEVVSAAETIVAGVPTLTPAEKAGIETGLAVIQTFAANLTVPTTAPPASLIAHQ